MREHANMRSCVRVHACVCVCVCARSKMWSVGLCKLKTTLDSDVISYSSVSKVSVSQQYQVEYINMATRKCRRLCPVYLLEIFFHRNLLMLLTPLFVCVCVCVCVVYHNHHLALTIMVHCGIL